VLLAVHDNQTKRSQEFVTELLKTVLEHLLEHHFMDAELKKFFRLNDQKDAYLLDEWHRKRIKEGNLFEETEADQQQQAHTPYSQDNEKINHIYWCARFTGLDTTEGLFLFGKEHFYVLDGYTLKSTKEIVDIDSLKNTTYEPLIPKCSTSSSTSSTSSIPQSTEKTCSKFPYEDIREVHNRRYLLQEIATEIFSNDGRNFLLVFPRKCRQKSTSV
jgi:hypothetical protein